MAQYDLGEFEISLENPSSINDAITKVHMLKFGVNKAMGLLHKYVLEQGVEIARAQLVRLSTWDATGGKIYESIHSSEFVFDEKTGKGIGYIVAGEGLPVDKHGNSIAVCVEFGTGVHSDESHKSAATSSAKSTTWKPTLKGVKQSEPAPEPKVGKRCVYFNEDTGFFYTTSGQPLKHFMSNTLWELWTKAEKEAGTLMKTYLPYEV